MRLDEWRAYALNRVIQVFPPNIRAGESQPVVGLCTEITESPSSRENDHRVDVTFIRHTANGSYIGKELYWIGGDNLETDWHLEVYGLPRRETVNGVTTEVTDP